MKDSSPWSAWLLSSSVDSQCFPHHFLFSLSMGCGHVILSVPVTARVKMTRLPFSPQCVWHLLHRSNRLFLYLEACCQHRSEVAPFCQSHHALGAVLHTGHLDPSVAARSPDHGEPDATRREERTDILKSI